MKKGVNLLFVLVLLCFSVTARAQEKLSLQEAVETALKNNFDIRISANEAEVARTNVSRANAGMIPTVDATLNTNAAISNTRQTLSNGTHQERNGARNSSLNYGVGLNWTIFDGFGMFATYKSLQEQQRLGEAQYQLTVQTAVSDVIGNYFEIVKLQQDVNASETAVEISRLRVNNAQARYQIGRAAKLEVLQATVDLNTDTTTLLRNIDLYRNSKTRLNELLARDLNTDFVVEDTILIQQDLKLAELRSNAEQQNPAIQSAVISQRVAELDLKQVRAARYPVIGVNSSYNFTNSRSALGFAQSSNGRGLNYGLSASVNIFNGSLQRRREKIAEIGIDNAELELSRLSRNITSQLTAQYQTYQTNLQLVRLEDQNLNVAKQKLDITMEKLKFGTLTPLEFREAQQNYISALTRLTNARYQAKVAEIFLKELAGTIRLQ
ncbi:MAG TPA: TolC family protein [Sphingobacteriaceae bacterium]